MTENSYRPLPPFFIGGRQPLEGQKLVPIQTDASGPIPKTAAALLAIVASAWLTQPNWPAQSYNRSVASFAGTEAPPVPQTSKQPARVEPLWWPAQRSAPVAAWAGTEPWAYTSKQPYPVPAIWWDSQRRKLNPSLLDNPPVVVVDQPFTRKQPASTPTVWWDAQQRWLNPALLRPEDNPPFGVRAQQWPYPVPSWPVQSAPRTQPLSVDNPPPLRTQYWEVKATSWPAQRGTQIAPLLSQVVTGDNPPFTKREITGPIQISWNWPAAPPLQNLRAIPQGGDWAAPPTGVGGYPWYYGDDRKKKRRIFPIVEDVAPPSKKAKKRSLPKAVVEELREQAFHVESVLPPAKSHITRELLDRWFEQEALAKLAVAREALNAKAKEDLLAEAKVAHKERLAQEEEMLLVSFLAAYYRSLR